MAKQKYIASLDNNPKKVRLRELEETIHSWWHGTSGRLWDPDDEEVQETLKERDKLFYELNPQLTGLNFHDMTEEDYEEIDRKIKENADKGEE
jgi:hypothetical protein